MLLQIQWENFFVQTSNQWQAKFCLFLGIHLSKLSWNEKPFLTPVPKQQMSKDSLSYGSQSERTKIAIHWFGKY